MYSSVLAHALGLEMTLKYTQPVTCENVLQTTKILNSLFLLSDQAQI